VAGAVDRVRRSAVAQRERGDLLDRGLELVPAEDGRVPGDVDHAGHQAPTSARIAPSPSAVLPSPSFSAPTTIAILPRCLLPPSRWCASPTWSNGIVCQRTGRMRPWSISALAFVHSHALAKCEPMICFWRIQR